MAIVQTPSAAVVPSVVTASAYASGDVIGNPFSIQYAAGGKGGWIGNVTMYDYASGGQNIRLHLFNSEPSAYNPTGTPFSIDNGDDDKYLGSVDVTGWISAGAAKRVAVVNNPGVAIYARSGARHVWCVPQALASTTFGATASALRVFMTTIQDGI